MKGMPFAWSRSAICRARSESPVRRMATVSPLRLGSAGGGSGVSSSLMARSVTRSGQRLAPMGPQYSHSTPTTSGAISDSSSASMVMSRIPQIFITTSCTRSSSSS